MSGIRHDGELAGGAQGAIDAGIAPASKAARDEAMSTVMTDGMEHSYGRLDGVLTAGV